jgi:hypothetical protein
LVDLPATDIKITPIRNEKAKSRPHNAGATPHSVVPFLARNFVDER